MTKVLIVAMEARAGSTATCARLLTVQPNKNPSHRWPQGEWNVVSSVATIARELCTVRNDAGLSSTARLSIWPAASVDPHFRCWDVLLRKPMQSLKCIVNGLWRGVSEAMELGEGYFAEKVLMPKLPVAALIEESVVFWPMRNPVDQVASIVAWNEVHADQRYAAAIRQNKEKYASNTAKGFVITRPVVARVLKDYAKNKPILIPFRLIESGEAWDYLASLGYKTTSNVQVNPKHRLGASKNKYLDMAKRAVEASIPKDLIEMMYEAERSLEAAEEMFERYASMCPNPFDVINQRLKPGKLPLEAAIETIRKVWGN